MLLEGGRLEGASWRAAPPGNPVTRVSDMSGGRVDLINKLLLPPSAMFMTAVTAMD